ncbi:MAG: DUF4405 domain-containing protein [Opitutales bacterium]
MKPGLKNQLKNPLMRATNLLLYLSFCALVGTGALLTWKLIPGSRGGGGLRVLDMSRHEWGDLHFWCGVVFLAATIAHLLLNWAWLKKIASSGKRWRLALGLGLGLAIIGGIYALPVSGGGDGSGGQGPRTISGE